MVEYNTVNAKLSDLQLDKLKKSLETQIRNNLKNEYQNV